ncbi:glycosyltransferase family 2 protein [Flavobacterium acetivorans]|uniref:glycosyltransferase family 2 protein n=1 Tax=Flavobacterium acetivorans TaxID=2893883 RepID=UPI001E33B569|nr:glycosyltransferase family 2 protein [Flavobacterium sp. F-29]UFH35718.1 glycosyltransferase [Flavobacterium sp. F-29]
MNSLVSIIIPTYNRAHLIGETLDSVLAQSYQNWECIIVDDGSTDNTSEIVGNYVVEDSRFQYHFRPREIPKGSNACRNYGFELSQGQYVNWFDDDDVMLEGFIFSKVNLFKNEQLKMVICSGFYVDENLVEMEKINLKIETFLFKDYVRWELRIMTPSILFRRSFLESRNLFDLNIHRGQETELFSRLFFNLPLDSFKIVNVPLFLYRQHINTKTRRSRSYEKRFKVSECYIALENLKRSIELNDLELMNYNYKILIDGFFRGIEKNHRNLSKDILKRLSPILNVKNGNLSLSLLLFGNLLLLLNRSSYRIEKFLRNHKVV